jgi:hypothetical protein
MLQTAGFIDIQETIVRAPLNGWPSDPHQKTIGRWYNLGLTDGLDALSLAPFTRVNRWNADEHVRPLVKEVKKEIAKSKVHAYNNMYVCQLLACCGLRLRTSGFAKPILDTYGLLGDRCNDDQGKCSAAPHRSAASLHALIKQLASTKPFPVGTNTSKAQKN